MKTTEHPNGDDSSCKTEDDTKLEQPSPVDHDAEAAKSECHAVTSPSPSPQPASAVEIDGGYGWVCCICVAVINAHTWGLNSSYGVFLAHYLANNTFPGATRLEYAFVGSLSIACALLVSPLATISTRKYSTRFTLFIGIAFETASLLGASWARQIWQLFLSQGVAFGIGMGFLFVGSVGIPAQWFTKRRSLANGIAAAGSGLGGLLYSLATGAMIKTIGLGWAFRVLGILACVANSICALLVRDRNKLIGTSQLAFDASLFKRPEYFLLNSCGFFSMLGYVVLLFSLANYANAIGLNASQASIVSALLNLGQGIGRPPIGYFSDRIGRINMCGLMSFLSGLFALVVWTFAKSYGVLIFYSVLGGTVAGTFWATVAPVTAEVVGIRNVPSALSLTWLFLVIPCAFSEPIALQIVSGTGNYLGAQLFTGFMYVAAAMAILLLRGWKIGEEEARARFIDNGEKDDAAALHAREQGRHEMWLHFWKWRKV